jgi:hypothetical protein
MWSALWVSRVLFRTLMQINLKFLALVGRPIFVPSFSDLATLPWTVAFGLRVPAVELRVGAAVMFKQYEPFVTPQAATADCNPSPRPDHRVLPRSRR